MLGGRLTFSALCGALLFPLLVPSLQSVAHADVYHAVAAGETLASVAAKYRVSTDQLRALNGLNDGDSSPLGAMLLRVPGTESKTALSSIPTVTASSATGFGENSLTPGANLAGIGTIGKTVSDTVNVGDTWESIAARYRAAGNDVSAEVLRRRNGWANAPTPGSSIVVPLGQIAYSAPVANPFAPSIPTTTAIRPSIAASAQTAPAARATTRSASAQAAAPRTLGGGVMASDEIDLPFAQDNTPSQPPVFGASIQPPAQPRRGSLSSRGGYGQLSRTAQGGQVRILTPEQDAAAPPASRARIATSPTATRANSIARVARVSTSGAKIRRLPESSAVTLYNCGVGTQLAVLRQSGIWSAVLMSDRSTGWLPTKYLAMTPQTVDVSAQITSNDPGGQVNGYAGSYAGENPMVSQALRWLGTPYRYGGTSRRGIDCSSLVQHAFAACGYGLPRTAAQQAKVGSAVVPAQLRAGDRLYFSASGTRIDHTGLYMGDGLFVHASGSGRQVMVSNLFTPRNWNIFVGARR